MAVWVDDGVKDTLMESDGVTVTDAVVDEEQVTVVDGVEVAEVLGVGVDEGVAEAVMYRHQIPEEHHVFQI